MSKNKYVTTRCVSTTQAQNGKINGIIERIKISDHKIMIETSTMNLIIRNRVNFFNCDDNYESYIGYHIYSWEYCDDCFLFKIDDDNMQVDVDGDNPNEVRTGNRKFGTVNAIQVTKHYVIIKTNRTVIKIKNKSVDFFNCGSFNNIIGSKLFGWKNKADSIIFETNYDGETYDNDAYIWTNRRNSDDVDKITFFDPATYVDKPIYGTVEEIERNRGDVTIKTTKGDFTFTGWYDEDGYESEFCPKLDKEIDNMIGKKIIRFKHKGRKVFIHCDNNCVYKLSAPRPDSFCSSGIRYDKWFF